MTTSWNNFSSNIKAVRKVGCIYDYLLKTTLPQEEYNDLLRVQLVNTISAFDRLIHDFLRISIVEQLKGNLTMTPKTISHFRLDPRVLVDLSNLSNSPQDQIKKHSILETKVVCFLNTMSFQHPDKVSDALSYIWTEHDKWEKISQGMKMQRTDLISRLKLYVERRNQIVHAADFNEASRSRMAISQQITTESIDLYYKLAQQIAILACGLKI